MKKFFSLLLVILLAAVCIYGAVKGTKDNTVSVVLDTEDTELIDSYMEERPDDDREVSLKSGLSGKDPLGLLDEEEALDEEEDFDEETEWVDDTEEYIEEASEDTEESTEEETEAVQEDTEEETEADTEDKVKIIPSSDKTFDYVALGNSVTCNVPDELWWGNWGMAASSAEKDYVHLISQWLGGQSKQHVSTTVINLKNWEVAADRNAKVSGYERYFNEYTDLITIQTGENITENKENLSTEYTNLLKMIKEKAPNAQILMIGELLWPAEDIETAKKNACSETGAVFIDATDFLNNYEAHYKSAMGVEVAGNDGSTHAIANETVAAHPNDEGMACIAQLFINKILVDN